MAVKRTKEPWMSAGDFGRSLPRGVGINLLVAEIAPMEAFLRVVMGARIIYSDEDFAAIELQGSVMMLHADHSYSDHPLSGAVAGTDVRGTGVEIRVYGADPDACEAAARTNGYDVLSGAIDKPHGLRECHLLAPFGYVFVPSAKIRFNGE